MPRFYIVARIAIALATFAVAPFSLCADVDVSGEKRDPQELVVGDWYEATFQRQQVKKRFSGYLVLANDDWLVLGKILAEGRTTRSNAFKFVGFGSKSESPRPIITRNYEWLPRSAVTLTEHTRYPNQAGFEDFHNDIPKLEKQGRVTVVEHGKVSDESYELVNVDGRQFRVATQKYELQQGEKSRWSGLPLIGGLFNNDQYVTRRVEQAVPIENVICVWQCSLYDLKNHRAIPAEETPDWFRN